MINKPLWSPQIDGVKKTSINRFILKINNEYSLNLQTYNDLYVWSINNIESFWKEIWNFSNIIYSNNYSKVLNHSHILDAEWFKNSKLNYAENLLKRRDSNIAIYFFGENELYSEISFNELYLNVAKLAFSLRKIGIKKGDRIAAVLPNMPETIIAMLAATSIGAIWSSCSPDFGEKAILDRFLQIKPKLIFYSDGYYYKGKPHYLKDKINNVINSLSSIKNSYKINYISNDSNDWNELINNNNQIIDFEQLDFNHPLFIMYSSGTTGKPKSIVHSVGGTLLQHLKEHILHVNLKKNDKFFYFTTCGWMMWNWLVSSLAIGVKIVLYDGHPFFPKNDSLLEKMNDIDINVFGTSAKYISSLNLFKIKASKFKFNNLRIILSTGSPLIDEDFEYVYDHWKSDVQLSSISGGTDIISCFALGCPILPVYKGELQCIGLGMSVKSYNTLNKHEIDSNGELICDQPFPSMPIGFWNDTDDVRYKKAYFSDIPNVWKHGDFIKINKRGGVIILGRSDTTLNPGGVRIGTSEIYQSLDRLNYIDDSIVVSKKNNNDEEIVLFIKINNEIELSDNMINEIKQTIKEKCSPRHVPSFIFKVNDIPYTINGKKIEIAVRNIVNGNEILNLDAISNPECLNEYKVSFNV